MLAVTGAAVLVVVSSSPQAVASKARTPIRINVRRKGSPRWCGAATIQLPTFLCCPSDQTILRSEAQRANSWRLLSCSLRRTAVMCVSTVFIEMLIRVATCL